MNKTVLIFSVDTAQHRQFHAPLKDNCTSNSRPSYSDTNEWQAPGERQYGLIAKVNAGSVYRNGRWYSTDQWFCVGADSGCFFYSEPDNRQLQFGINDPNMVTTAVARG